MKKRKIRINGMDFAILAVIAAAVFLILYIFVWSDDTDTIQSETAEILYVVEVVGIDEQFEDLIKEGQRVEDAVKRGVMGTVEGKPEVRDMLKAEFDNVSGQEVYNTVPGKSNLYITIRADASVTDRGYSVNDEYIYVGAQLSMVFPEMKCDGYCIQLDVVE